MAVHFSTVSSMAGFQENSRRGRIRNAVPHDIITDDLWVFCQSRVGTVVENLAVDEIEARGQDVNCIVLEIQVTT